ncbi:MAG: purine-nucleoside phosphorylase [Candidatus Eisenbacteria bacterium]|nr:purine-nucleoside phosphorylase [Candidatus Eisenbacteria bacterium]
MTHPRDRHYASVSAAARLLIDRGLERPDVAVVLGSGLSSFADGLGDALTVPYSDIPGFPHTAVSGHRGAAVGCTLGGKRTLVFAGRVHHYEGWSPDDVTFSVRLAAELGAGVFVITNASGGIDTGFDVGNLMLISDQIAAVSGVRRLPQGTFRMGGAYSERLKSLAREAASDSKIRLREGVYMGSLGPTYETPAEIRMARAMGASAVGMSTVSEVQAARSMGLDVLGIALITNVPLPGRFHETTHEEVLEAGRLGAGALVSLVSGTLERL